MAEKEKEADQGVQCDAQSASSRTPVTLRGEGETEATLTVELEKPYRFHDLRLLSFSRLVPVPGHAIVRPFISSYSILSLSLTHYQ